MSQTNNNDTVCIDCCFAEWNKEKTTQTGCSRGMLEKFEKAGSDVLECYNGDYEFNVIQGRKCPYKRHAMWHQHFEERGGVEARLKEETKLPYSAVIFSNGNLDDIEKTVRSLDQQELKPIHITIIQPKNLFIIPGDIADVVDQFSIPWKVTNELVEKVKGATVWHTVKTVKKAQYVSIFTAGYEVPSDFYSNLNRFVIEDLNMFAAILPEDEQGLTIPYTVYEYWYFMGNPEKTILENIQEWEKTENKKVCFKRSQILAS